MESRECVNLCAGQSGMIFAGLRKYYPQHNKTLG